MIAGYAWSFFDGIGAGLEADRDRAYIDRIASILSEADEQEPSVLKYDGCGEPRPEYTV